MTNFKAAWVPWHDKLGFDGAVLLAIKWLQQQASHGQRTLVVTPLKQTLGYCPPLERFARANYTTTPRSSQRTATPHGVPVLAYAPNNECLQLAMERAEGSHLCVVADVVDNRRAWAADVQAIDLVTGKVTDLSRDPEHVKLMEHLMFTGNNGWARGFGRDRALDTLRELQSRGWLDVDDIVGYALAHGIDFKSIETLRELVNKMS